jgi:hypothetical protein
MLTEVTDENLKNELLGINQGSDSPITSGLKVVEDKALIQDLLQQQAADTAVKSVNPNLEAQDKPKTTYLERLSSLRESRIKEVSDTFEKFAEGEIGAGSAALQTVGKGAFGGALDLVGETVVTGLGTVTPDFIKDPFKEAMMFAVSEASDTEFVKGAKAEWDKLDETTKKNLESTGNILSFIIPKVKLGKAGAKTKGLGEAIRKNRISKEFKLPETASNKIKEAQRGFRDPIGHKQMVEVVSKIKGVKDTNSPVKNLKLINKELELGESRVMNLVRTQPKKIEIDEVYQAFQRNLDELFENQTWIASDTTIQNSLKNNLKAVNKIVGKHPKTTEGLLKARREIDKLMNEKKFEIPAHEQTARDAITQTLRNAANEVLDSKYPTGAYKDLMFKQHNMLNATKILSQKIGHETPSFSKALALAKQHPVITGGIINGSGLFIGLLTNPFLVAGSLAGGAGTLAFRGMPQTLKGLGSLIEGTAKVPLPMGRAAALNITKEEQNQ